MEQILGDKAAAKEICEIGDVVGEELVYHGGGDVKVI